MLTYNNAQSCRGYQWGRNMYILHICEFRIFTRLNYRYLWGTFALKQMTITYWSLYTSTTKPLWLTQHNPQSEPSVLPSLTLVEVIDAFCPSKYQLVISRHIPPTCELSKRLLHPPFLPPVTLHVVPLFTPVPFFSTKFPCFVYGQEYTCHLFCQLVTVWNGRLWVRSQVKHNVQTLLQHCGEKIAQS